MKPRFQFGNVVVVGNGNIGMVVKTWDGRANKNRKPGYYHEVYVRYNGLIEEYHEDDINHYVYSKELTEEEKEFY